MTLRQQLRIVGLQRARRDLAAVARLGKAALARAAERLAEAVRAGEQEAGEAERAPPPRGGRRGGR